LFFGKYLYIRSTKHHFDDKINNNILTMQQKAIKKSVLTNILTIKIDIYLHLSQNNEINTTF